MFCPHLGHTGEEEGTVFDLGRTESTFLAVSIERKLARYGGRK